MKNIGIAIRSLFKRGQHNVMKIISLGIGLTIGLVLIAKVHFENTYDNFYPDGDRIYRVYEKFFMNGEVGDHGQCSSETLSKFSPNPCTCSYPTRSPNVSAVT